MILKYHIKVLYIGCFIYCKNTCLLTKASPQANCQSCVDAGFLVSPPDQTVAKNEGRMCISTRGAVQMPRIKKGQSLTQIYTGADLGKRSTMPVLYKYCLEQLYEYSCSSSTSTTSSSVRYRLFGSAGYRRIPRLASPRYTDFTYQTRTNNPMARISDTRTCCESRTLH